MNIPDADKNDMATMDKLDEEYKLINEKNNKLDELNKKV